MLDLPLRVTFALTFLVVPRLAAAADVNRPAAFLDKAAAAEAIVQEKIEPYFSLLTPLDMAVKTGSPLEGETLDQQRQACKERYRAAMLDFSDEEKELLLACIERVQPILKEHYPLAAATPWSLIKKSDRLEGGAHFTRERHIVLSASFLAAALKRKGQVADDELAAGVLRLLLHEQTHVLQRLHPKLFAAMYADLWGLERASSIEGDHWLKDRQLVNPDAVDVNWIAKVKDDAGGQRIVWPRIVMTKTQWPAVMFRDAAMVTIELEPAAGKAGSYRVKLDADGVPVQTPLPKDKAFTRLFPHGNAYHPNEAAAALWPAVVLGDLFPDAGKSGGAAKELEVKARAWLRERMKAGR